MLGKLALLFAVLYILFQLLMASASNLVQRGTLLWQAGARQELLGAAHHCCQAAINLLLVWVLVQAILVAQVGYFGYAPGSFVGAYWYVGTFFLALLTPVVLRLTR